MVWTEDRCVICGKILPCTKVKSRDQSSRYEAKILAEWKRECSTATCEVLFGNQIENFVRFFQNTTYCSTCKQIVRDISFTWKQLKSFENKMHRLSTQIRNLLDLNNNNIEEKSETKTMQERFSLLSSKKVPNIESLYSYEEIIQIICSGVQNSKQSVQNWNIYRENSVLSPSSLRSPEGPDYLSHVKLERSLTLENQLGIDEIKEEEYSDDEKDNDGVSSFETGWNNELQDLEHFDDIKHNETSENPLKKENNDENVNSSASITKRKGPRESKGCSAWRKVHLMRLSRMKFKFSCPEEGCSRCFANEEDLTAHILKHKGVQKPYECRKCLMKFTNKPHLVRHVQVVHEDKRERKRPRSYCCRLCGKRYVNVDQLTLHLSTSHQEPNPYQCAFCPEKYDNSDDLKIHTEELHSNPYDCDICPRTYRTQDLLTKHKRNMHSIKPLKKQKPKNSKVSKPKPEKLIKLSHECKYCGKDLITEEELKAHYTGSHQPENPFACGFCPQLCSNTTDLKKHTKSEHQNPNDILGKRKCPFCDRYFANKSSLCVHKKSHLDPSLLHKCPLCPAFYKQKYMLDNHLETHSEERKYKCDLCGNSYKTKHCLHVHSKKHDESQRKWKCAVCDRKFFTSKQRKSHEICHSNIKEYICQVCGKQFNRDQGLISHLKTHTTKSIKV